MPYKKKEKISLMLYYDYLEQFECLTDEQLRKLIYAMIEFDKNEKEIELDKVTKMAFIPIKKRLKLDKKKWLETCQTNSKNAKIRWDKEDAIACDRMPKDAKYADIERDIDIEKEIELDKVTKMAFIPIKKRLKLDKKKWIETCQTNSKNAKIRWDKENATVCDGMPKDAKYADIERDIDIEKEIDKERESNNIYPTNTPTLSELRSFCQENDMEEFDCEYFYNHYEANGWTNGNGSKIKDWQAKVKKWYKDDLKNGKIKKYDTSRRLD